MASKKGQITTTKQYKYSTPVLYKDKENKKWCARYSITYTGEKTEYRKEYFKTIGGLNRIENLIDREVQATIMIKALDKMLSDGIDKVRVAQAKVIIQKKVEAQHKFSFENTFTNHLKELNYFDPEQGTRWSSSAKPLKDFFNNIFKAYFEEHHPELLIDVRKFDREHLYNFFHQIYVVEKRWVYSTLKSRKGMISSYFTSLIANNIRVNNPCDNIVFKNTAGKQAITPEIQTYSKKEIDIIWDYLKDSKTLIHHQLELSLKVLYYGYIRQEEQFRIKMRNFDFENKTITIFKEESKRQSRDMNVYMQPQLIAAFKKFLTIYPIKGDELLLKTDYHALNYAYKLMLVDLKVSHPKLFKNDISIYGMKHSGCVSFVQENMSIKTASSILIFLRNQCRHSNLKATEEYLKDLNISLDTFEDFKF